jgi:hypothetical protein
LWLLDADVIIKFLEAKMLNENRIRSVLVYAVIVGVTFVFVQTLVVISHEFTHSTVAWLLGHMRSPLDIVWGNPVTLRGWDEGVDYKELFSSGQLAAAAIIGVSPLIMHTAVVTLGIALMRKGMPASRWLFHALFWFVIGNFMELVAYITMRSFVSSGDVGIFNWGVGISPWFLFVAGSLVIVWGVSVGEAGCGWSFTSTPIPSGCSASWDSPPSDWSWSYTTRPGHGLSVAGKQDDDALAYR